MKELFEERLRAAECFGVGKSRLCFDPGVGFSKTYEDNLKLIPMEKPDCRKRLF